MRSILRGFEKEQFKVDRIDRMFEKNTHCQLYCVALRVFHAAADDSDVLLSSAKYRGCLVFSKYLRFV